jgi:hypothetical protein
MLLDDFSTTRREVRRIGTLLAQVTLLEDNFKNFRGKIIDVGL